MGKILFILKDMARMDQTHILIFFPGDLTYWTEDLSMPLHMLGEVVIWGNNGIMMENY
jgi:hypothetical protein